MKKMILSVTLLLALASVSDAADKKQTAVNNNAVENKVGYSANTISVAEMNYMAMVEENTRLKIQASELTFKIDDLASKLDYTQMMHVTITNLHDVVVVNSLDDAKSQLDYARMMNATLVNLANVSARL